MLTTVSASSGFIAQMFTTAGPRRKRFFSDAMVKPRQARGGAAEGAQVLNAKKDGLEAVA